MFLVSHLCILNANFQWQQSNHILIFTKQIRSAATYLHLSRDFTFQLVAENGCTKLSYRLPYLSIWWLMTPHTAPRNTTISRINYDPPIACGEISCAYCRWQKVKWKPRKKGNRNWISGAVVAKMLLTRAKCMKYTIWVAKGKWVLERVS